MRILLDNNIPYRFKRAVADLDVRHVQDVSRSAQHDGLTGANCTLTSAS